MADLAPTATHKGASATRTLDVQFGEAIAASDMVYLKASDGKYYRADANVTAAEALTAGICLVGGAIDGFGIIATAGVVILVGVAMDIGDAYYLSRNIGKIMPQLDLQPGDFVSYLGNATAATFLDLNINNFGTLLV